MFASFQKKYFLSDKGIAGVKRGVFWTALTNLITMAGMGFLFLVMAGFVEHLASGADLPDALPIVGGLLVFFVLLFASNCQQKNSDATNTMALAMTAPQSSPSTWL